MAHNKIVYGTQTLIDLTSDTVSSDKLFYGTKAHSSNGQQITGSFTIDLEISNQNNLISQILSSLSTKGSSSDVTVKLTVETHTILESSTYLNADYEAPDYTKVIFIGMFYSGNSNYQEGRKVDSLICNVSYFDPSTGEAFYTTAVTGDDSSTVASNGTQKVWHYKQDGVTYLSGDGTYSPKVFTSGHIRLASASATPNFMNVGDTYKCIIGELV